jgi:hypothetical protein
MFWQQFSTVARQHKWCSVNSTIFLWDNGTLEGQGQVRCQKFHKGPSQLYKATWLKSCTQIIFRYAISLGWIFYPAMSILFTTGSSFCLCNVYYQSFIIGTAIFVLGITIMWTKIMYMLKWLLKSQTLDKRCHDPCVYKWG